MRNAKARKTITLVSMSAEKERSESHCEITIYTLVLEVVLITMITTLLHPERVDTAVRVLQSTTPIAMEKVWR